jgi:hypothetical protein
LCIVPLNAAMRHYYAHRVMTKDCPRCFEEIPALATRCKFCCADIELEAEAALAEEGEGGGGEEGDVEAGGGKAAAAHGGGKCLGCLPASFNCLKRPVPATSVAGVQGL